MASFTDPVPPGLFTPPLAEDWLNKLQKFQKNVAKLTDAQTFSVPQNFTNGKIQNGPVLLADGGFDAMVTIGKITSNQSQVTGLGGRAALYVQHQVDDGVATVAVVNSGIRVQMQTFQRSSSVGVNDTTGGYFGLYNAGVNSAGFGMHTDSYHAATGSNSTTYGGNAEMFRLSAAGFTVGFHTRSIGGGGSGGGFFDNDYAFCASPSAGGGTQRFKSVFSAGSIQTGTMGCDVILDGRFAQVNLAGAYFLDDIPVVWGDNLSAHTRRIVGGNPGRIELRFNATRIFSVSDAGIAEFANSGVTSVVGAPSGKALKITDTAGNVWKILLNA